MNLPVLRMENIHKRFGHTEVLKGVTLNVNTGDVVAVLGRSGAGKTTLLRVVNFLIKPDQGTVFFKGMQIEAKRNLIRRVRSRIGFVFQGFNLISHLTALDNVSLALRYVKEMSKKESRYVALKQLKAVGLDDKANSYPSQLSGGQQQRVGIARALAVEPDLILFDEPTSALDPSLVGEVMSVMKELSQQGRTMIVVTHEMNFARTVANRILFMDDGFVCLDTCPVDFFEDRKNKSVMTFLNSMSVA